MARIGSFEKESQKRLNKKREKGHGRAQLKDTPVPRAQQGKTIRDWRAIFGSPDL